MFEALFQSIQKPTLWQRGTEPFWDDEHISKGMLEAHLNPDWDAASRKHEFINRSVRWLSGVIPAKSKILDLGCGPGLYTKRLSGLGYDVTGMDYSRRSIEYAKSQDTKTNYIYQNYLTLDHVGIFDTVTLIYCDYAALTLEERKVLLEKVYNTLVPGGLFILDVDTEHCVTQKPNRKTWAFCEKGGFWNAEPHLCLEETVLYNDNTVAVDHILVVTRDGVKEYFNWVTGYTVERFAAEVSPFGFTVKSVFDDVCGKTFSGEAETLCFVLERGEK